MTRSDPRTRFGRLEYRQPTHLGSGLPSNPENRYNSWHFGVHLGKSRFNEAAMRKHLLRTTALTLALLGGAGFAAAQSQTTQQPGAKDPTPAQVAPAEPKSETTPHTCPAFVNGALP